MPSVKHLCAASLSATLLGMAGAAEAADHLTVQMAFYPQGPQAYLFVAREKGWFKEAGLDVDILDGRGSNYSVQVLSSGHADIGEGDLPPLVFARQRGADIKAIAEWFPEEGPGIVVPADSDIKNPADLRGKRVGVVAAGPWPPLLPSFLKQFNLGQNDLSLVYVSSASLFSTYAAKQTDAMLTVDLAYSEADPMRPSRLLKAADYGIEMPGDGLFARSDELTGDKAKVIARFLAVCSRAISYVYDGHAEEAAADIHRERPQLKLPVDLIVSQIKAFGSLRQTPNTKGKPPGWQSEEDWKNRLAYMQKTGLVKGAASPNDFFTDAMLPQQPGK